MEADLQRWYGIDYRDRWRFDNGRRRLTLRRVGVLLANLPSDSAVARLHPGWSPWNLEHHLLDENRMAVLAAGGVKDPKPHPDRSKRASVTLLDPVRKRKIAAAQARARQRRRAIEAGEIS